MHAATPWDQPAWQAAPDLLGWHLCRRLENQILRGRIVETEGYAAGEDAASHAFRGPTPRNLSMFGPAGRAYVYFIYGNHHCFNVVAHSEGQAGAVLIRALEPLQGIDLMQRHRGHKLEHQLCSGPGKLCQALAIDRGLEGCNLQDSSELWLEPASIDGLKLCGPRLGIRRGLELPWRFWLAGNRHLSKSGQGLPV